MLEINLDRDTVQFLLEERRKSPNIKQRFLERLGKINQFGKMMSKNEQMLKNFIIGKQYKDDSYPILIEGEKGVGKEALAREIVRSSNLKGDFLIFNKKINLKNLTQYEKAILYFKDISTLNEKKQQLLNQYLQSQDRLATGPRIIAATSQNLTSLVKEAKFDPGLYYRLTFIRLKIPSLKERREDILPLFDFFIRQYSNQKKNLNNFSSALLVKIVEYDWPRNVDELKKEAARLIISHGQKDVFTTEMAPPHIVGKEMKGLLRVLKQKRNLNEAINLLEKRLILESLRRSNWNKSKVSRELGISRSGLIQKVDKYQLERSL